MDTNAQEPSLPNAADERPRLLLMGLRRSGKSSIQKVVFHKMAPNETLFLESTNRINKDHISSFIDFQIWDFPGQIDFFDPAFDFEAIFGNIGALVYIVDAQDEYYEALVKLHSTITKAYSINPLINIEVLIHKVDGLSDDYKIDIQRDIQQRVQDELADVGLENVQLSFYLTSIFDHTIFEAFSKVIQKLIPQLPTLENILNIFCSSSVVEKSFLFDIQSKIYLATDSSPVDLQSYELCSDYIDVMLDMTSIYGPETHELSAKNGASTVGTTSVIQLGNGNALYLKELNSCLALICLIRVESLNKTGLLEYNVQCLQTAIQDIFNAANQYIVD